MQLELKVVYPFFSTSNHNQYLHLESPPCVVYPFFSTSNHNSWLIIPSVFLLYIRSFLHQTTTPGYSHFTETLLYIRSFLHQTTTFPSRYSTIICCISVLFYIKPQQTLHVTSGFVVVYPFFSTSNHNGQAKAICVMDVVYPFFSTSNHNMSLLSD